MIDIQTIRKNFETFLLEGNPYSEDKPLELHPYIFWKPERTRNGWQLDEFNPIASIDPERKNLIIGTFPPFIYALDKLKQKDSIGGLHCLKIFIQEHIEYLKKNRPRNAELNIEKYRTHLDELTIHGKSYSSYQSLIDEFLKDPISNYFYGNENSLWEFMPGFKKGGDEDEKCKYLKTEGVSITDIILCCKRRKLSSPLDNDICDLKLNEGIIDCLLEPNSKIENLYFTSSGNNTSAFFLFRQACERRGKRIEILENGLFLDSLKIDGRAFLAVKLPSPSKSASRNLARRKPEISPLYSWLELYKEEEYQYMEEYEYMNKRNLTLDELKKQFNPRGYTNLYREDIYKWAFTYCFDKIKNIEEKHKRNLEKQANKS